MDPAPAPRNNRRGLRSREEILQAAMRVMGERGFEATSLSHLREATNLPSSSIYHHFGSKANLLAAVIAWGAEHYQEDVAAPLDEETYPGPRELLHARLVWDTGIHHKHEDFFRMVMLLLLTNDIPEAAEAAAAVRVEGRARVHSYIEEAFALVRPEMAGRIADHLADFALSSLEGIVSLGSRSGADPDVLLDQLASAVHHLGTAYRPAG